jgi:DNA-binding transcriptional LysR family regulator
MKRLILAEIGIGFLPRINVLDELRQSSLRAVEVQGLELRRDLALVFHRDRDLTRAGKVFLQVATGASATGNLA